VELVDLGSSSSMDSFAFGGLIVVEWRRIKMNGDATSSRR